METPSSTRRVSRSQACSRFALIDITNDSPIVGLAMEREMPSSGVVGKSVMTSPGLGEALLRGQVKSLLQKVEEEEEAHHQLSKVSMVTCPTPENTPHLTNLSVDGIGIGIGGPIVIALPVVEEKLRSTCEVVSLESQKSVITRSLLLDFSEEISEDESYEEEQVDEV